MSEKKTFFVRKKLFFCQKKTFFCETMVGEEQASTTMVGEEQASTTPPGFKNQLISMLSIDNVPEIKPIRTD